MWHIDWLWVMLAACFTLSVIGIYRDRARYKTWFHRKSDKR